MGTSGKAVGGAKFGSTASEVSLAKSLGADIYDVTGIAVSSRTAVLVGKSRDAGGKKGKGKGKEIFRADEIDVQQMAAAYRRQRTGQAAGKGSRSSGVISNFKVLTKGELAQFKAREGVTANPTAKVPIKLAGNRGMLVKRGNKVVWTSANDGSLRTVVVDRKVVPQAIRAMEGVKAMKAAKPKSNAQARDALRKHLDSTPSKLVGGSRGSTVGRSPEFKIQARRKQAPKGQKNKNSDPAKVGPKQRELSTKNFNKDGTRKVRGPRRQFRRGKAQSAADQRQSQSIAKKKVTKKKASKKTKG